MGKVTSRNLCFLAARAASSAAAGRGSDRPQSDAATKDRLREQARTWLAEDLRMLSTMTSRVPDEEGWKITREFLDGWRMNDEFAAVRDAEALAKLPRAQRDAWLALWAELDAQIARLRQGPQKTPARR